MKRFVLLFAASMSISIANAATVNIDIDNSSFEDQDIYDGSSTLNGAFSNSDSAWLPDVVQGWTITPGSGSGSSAGTQHFFEDISPLAIDGDQVAYLNDGAISQLLGVNLEANTIYNLSLYVGDRTTPGFDIAGLGIDLLAGGSVLTGGEATFSPDPIPEGEWSLYTYKYFSNAAGGELGISLSSSAKSVQFDAVTLTATSPVPEPHTYAMFLAGLGLFGLAKRRHG